MTRIVGVHGVHQYRSGETPEQSQQALSQIWRAGLAKGRLGTQADSFDLTVAYYAHHLQKPGQQGGDDLDNLEPEVEEAIRSWLDLFDMPDGVSQGHGTWPLRQMLAWIAERRGLGKAATEKFVTQFFREVTAYLSKEDGAQSPHILAREQVAATLTAAQPRIVLAHSLGSVVAYEALWAHPEIQVETLITLGSPLALPHAVFPRLTPEPRDGQGSRPANVRRWINLADPGDLIAIPPNGVSSRFKNVDLDDHASIGAFSFHKAAKYLACDKVAATIGQAIAG